MAGLLEELEAMAQAPERPQPQPQAPAEPEERRDLPGLFGLAQRWPQMKAALEREMPAATPRLGEIVAGVPGGTQPTAQRLEQVQEHFGVLPLRDPGAAATRQELGLMAGKMPPRPEGVPMGIAALQEATKQGLAVRPPEFQRLTPGAERAGEALHARQNLQMAFQDWLHGPVPMQFGQPGQPSERDVLARQLLQDVFRQHGVPAESLERQQEWERGGEPGMGMLPIFGPQMAEISRMAAERGARPDVAGGRRAWRLTKQRGIREMLGEAPQITREQARARMFDPTNPTGYTPQFLEREERRGLMPAQRGEAVRGIVSAARERGVQGGLRDPLGATEATLETARLLGEKSPTRWYEDVSWYGGM